MPICSDTGGGIGETLHDNILKPAAIPLPASFSTHKADQRAFDVGLLANCCTNKVAIIHTMTLPLAFLAACMIVLCHGQGHDLTLEAGTRGPEVVEAVVEKIRSRCVFPEDRQFLRRVAHVVSKDGAGTDTYGPHFHGGIWKVTEAMFNATQDCYNEDIRLACSNISASFNIQWPSVAWSELRKPLYSGLALALATLLNVENDTPMPGSVTGQGELWARMYGGNRSEFASDANLEANFECNVKMDLVFILDSSGSISNNDFWVMLKFAADVIDAMDISADHVLVAGIVYSTTTKTQFDFNDYTTKAEALELMKNTTKEGGATRTDLALIQAANVLYRTDAGARDDAKKVAILITDGKSKFVNSTSDAGKRLKDLGTSVFAIGVGNYSRDELNAVASYPTCSHVLTLTSFTHIQSILTGIQKSVCETHKTCDGNTTSTSTRQLCKTTLPDDKHVIACEVSCGMLDVYVSITNTKPGPVLYDYKYQVKPGTPTVLTVTKRLAAGTKVYTNVVGTPFTGAAATNCSYRWSLSVTRQKDVKVICKENGVKRTCTNRDVDKAGLCSRDEFPFENPCTRENLKRGLMRHPHPYDSTKFLLCDLTGEVYEASCPGDDIFNKDTCKCGFTSPGPPGGGENGNYSLANNNGNPCSPEAIAKGQFYFPYSPDETKFIQCNEWGEFWVMPCAPGTVWSQDPLTCIRKGDNVKVVARSRTVVSLPVGDNPCTPEARAKGQFYFPYSSDETKFIQCNEWGKYWVMPCAPGTVWSQDAYTCIRKGGVSGSVSVVEVFCKENGVRRDCTKRDVAEAALCAKDKITFKNPCSRKNLKRRLLRHPYPSDSTKFLLCDLTGTVYLVCCPDDVTFNYRTRQCGSKPSGPPPPTGPSNPGNPGPCTPQAIARGQFYFPYYPDETKFIQCNEWGKYWVMPCAPGTVWSQKAYTCIRKGYNPGPNPGSPVTSPPQWTSSALYRTTTASVPGSLKDNPCTPAARTKCRFYFTYSPDETKFFQCNEWGESWVRPCAPGTVWSQDACTCIRKGDNPGPNSEPTVTSPPATTTPVYQPTTTSSPNPCTEEALANEQFYFPNESDETKYIQCDRQGGAVVKQCQPGTTWSQDHYRCIKKGAE